MKKMILLSMVLVQCVWAGFEWNSGTITFPMDQGANSPVVVAAGPSAGQAVAVWADSNFHPVYSIYSDGAWSEAAQISGGTFTAFYAVFVSQVPGTGEVIATWNDKPSGQSYYSLYNGFAWTSPSTIPAPNVSVDITSTPGNSQTFNRLFAFWPLASSHNPYNAYFHNGSWVSNAFVSTISVALFDVYGIDVYVDSMTNLQMSAWVDAATGYPVYATSTDNGNTWAQGTITTSFFGNQDVVLALGPDSDQITATWATPAPSPAACYAVYTGGMTNTWGMAGTIPLGASNGPATDVVVAPGPISGQMMAVWADSTTYQPYYSLYKSGVWGTASTIPVP